MKKYLSYDDIDALCERISDNKYKCGAWWPSLEEIKTKIEPDMDANIEFAIWISETAEEPVTDAQKEASTYLRSLIYKHLNSKVPQSGHKR